MCLGIAIGIFLLLRKSDQRDHVLMINHHGSLTYRCCPDAGFGLRSSFYRDAQACRQCTLGRQRTYTNTMALLDPKVGKIHNTDC
jgi:hypothetical protein